MSTLAPFEKRCRICNEPKPIGEFPLHSTSLDGHSARCVGCVRAQYARGRSVDPETLFAMRVNKDGPMCERLGTQCWPWTEFTNRKGYGHLNFRGEMMLAHRVAWIIENGPIDDGLWVLHKCDFPPCCRPIHLFLGDSDANIADMRAKGRERKARGEAQGSAKLTEAIVREIRADNRRTRQDELARRYGVNPATISRILNGFKWRYLAQDPPPAAAATDPLDP